MKKKFKLLLQFMVNFIMKHKQQTERQSPSKSKEFQRKYFPSCYASGRVYLEKKAIQKNPIQKNFCFKNLRSTISFKESGKK